MWTTIGWHFRLPVIGIVLKAAGEDIDGMMEVIGGGDQIPDEIKKGLGLDHIENIEEGVATLGGIFDDNIGFENAVQLTTNFEVNKKNCLGFLVRWPVLSCGSPRLNIVFASLLNDNIYVYGKLKALQQTIEGGFEFKKDDTAIYGQAHIGYKDGFKNAPTQGFKLSASIKMNQKKKLTGRIDFENKECILHMIASNRNSNHQTSHLMASFSPTNGSKRVGFFTEYTGDF